MQRRGWRRFFLRGGRLHPLWRALVYLLSFLVAEVVLDLLVALTYVGALLLTGRSLMDVLGLLAIGRLPRPILLATGLTRLGTALGLALLLGRFLDREPVETMGLDRSRVGQDGAVGVALGLSTMLALGGVRLALGWADLGPGPGTPGGFLLDAVALLPLAAAEEVAFRGYLLRALTTWRGPAVGVVVTSLLFALFHALNPNPSWLAMLNIALAGVVFALAAERAGTLWLAVGYHFAWNLAQGPLLGMPVSGMKWEGLLGLGTEGPALWTGGLFGPEGGLLATGVLLLSLPLLWMATRRPATLAAACRHQRAAVEARFGPLPHFHHRLEVNAAQFDGMVRALDRYDRDGEVVLLLRRADGDLLLHTKSFYPVRAYRLPSGGIRRGEPVLEAACREAEEEAGLAVREPRPLGLLTYRLRQGRRRLFFHSWLVVGGVEGEPATNDDRERISGFRWVPLDELSQVATKLRALPPEWAGWGRFRALAHDAALRWLSSEE
ncbi:MAG TPA: NUDIX domain-containing protein [Anaerolineales bacterium]|nr:NUDIX domain-containing protein [Anaerolineae bacterium]HIQ01235.1 NUDIX domain-containing protein [Anaerolineales bacterium]